MNQSIIIIGIIIAVTVIWGCGYLLLKSFTDNAPTSIDNQYQSAVQGHLQQGLGHFGL